MNSINNKLDLRNKNLMFIEQYKIMGKTNVKELYSNLSFMPSCITNSIENIINETILDQDNKNILETKTLVNEFQEIKQCLENID
jgi:hypothetical protein